MVLAGTEDLPQAGAWAVGLLEEALRARGFAVQRDELTDGTPGIAIGLAEARAPRAVLADVEQRCPTAPESVLIAMLTPHRCVLAGRDATGLAYAVTEAARAIELGTASQPFDDIAQAAESPDLPWRSMQLFRGNEQLEEPWYFSESFWDAYLAELVRCRYNNLTLTFAHQTAYLAPPYPFHVELPEFPQVKAIGLSDSRRQRNLTMLQYISRTAQQRGLHFTLAVWQQHDAGFGEPMVEGLTEDIRGQVNALGLRRLLEACPGIDGVQFRMNVEAGVPEHQQTEYWQHQFEAIAEVGRLIRVDLRAKGLSNQTIEMAQRILPDVVVSTKYWCEHLGMPYVMPAVQRVDTRAYRRYGTYDLLARPRVAPLIYRLWSFGSQRILLWGNPAYVQRFAQSCHFGAAGFEVGAPLTNKGGRNVASGYWPVIKDPRYLPYEYEYQRYWMFYLLFGRIGYNHEAPAHLWRRELHARFGAAAEAVERAYAASGQVMPVVTVVMQVFAGLWGFWPELFAGRSLFEDIYVEPSDPTQFYGVDEYAEAALNGVLCGKWTPFQVAAHLRRLAEDTREAADDAETQLQDSDAGQWPTTSLDMAILEMFAKYHACRLEAAAHWAIFLRNRDSARLIVAVQQMREARAHWCTLSEAAAPYHEDLIFGMVERHHNGHWRDRIEHVDKEIELLEHQLVQVDLTSVQDKAPAPEPLCGERSAERHVALHYDPPQSAKPGADLPVRVTVESDIPCEQVICHYRRALQTLPFRSLILSRHNSGYEGVIAGDQIDECFDLMLFFEVRFADGEAVRRPDWRHQTPYHVIRTDG
ncbi:MAG: hypothetical protein ACOC9P_00395 [bacterium]